MIDPIRKPSGRPINREARAEKRAQILDGARTCFLCNGFHKATIALISKEANVNVASIYQYFENKDAVIEALAEQMVAQDMTRLTSFDPDRLDVASLRMFADAMYNSQAGREVATIRSEILSEAARNPKISEYVTAGSSRIISAMTDFVKRFQDRGDVPSDLDPHSAAAELAYFHEGIQMHIPLAPDRRAELLEIHVAFIAARLRIRQDREN